MIVHPMPRGRRRARVAPLLISGLILLSACSTQEITHTRNGVEVTPDDLPEEVAEIDACAAISDATLDYLGLQDLEAVVLQPPEGPGCQWEGPNGFVTPSLTIWVSEAEPGDPGDEQVSIDGVAVNVYSALGNTGRYVAYLDDVTLAVNYTGGEREIDAHEALEPAMSEVLDHYDRS